MFFTEQAANQFLGLQLPLPCPSVLVYVCPYVYPILQMLAERQSLLGALVQIFAIGFLNLKVYREWNCILYKEH